MVTDPRAQFELAALEHDCGIVDPENNHEERIMYFADDESGIEPAPMHVWVAILAGCALGLYVWAWALISAARWLGLAS